jgi:hypothetical protein
LTRNVSAVEGERSAGGAVIAEEGLDVVGDEDAALAVAFADDRDRAVVDVDRGVEEAGQFADAHAGGEKEFGRDVGSQVGEGGRLIVEEKAPEVGSRDHARKSFGHPDADARAAEWVLGHFAVFLEPAEHRAERGQVAFHARLFQRAHVEEVADVVVDHGFVACGDGRALAEELREAGEVELVGARRVRRELPDRPAVADECGRRVSEQHVSTTSQNW